MEWQLSGGEVEQLQRKNPKVTEAEEIEDDLEHEDDREETRSR